MEGLHMRLQGLVRQGLLTVTLLISGSGAFATSDINGFEPAIDARVYVAQRGRLSQTMEQHVATFTGKTLCVGEVRTGGRTHVGIWFNECDATWLSIDKVTLLNWQQERYGTAYFQVLHPRGFTIGSLVKTGRIVLDELCTESYEHRCEVKYESAKPEIVLK
jgi:hypothetical protein